MYTVVSVTLKIIHIELIAGEVSVSEQTLERRTPLHIITVVSANTAPVDVEYFQKGDVAV